MPKRRVTTAKQRAAAKANLEKARAARSKQTGRHIAMYDALGKAKISRFWHDNKHRGPNVIGAVLKDIQGKSSVSGKKVRVTLNGGRTVDAWKSYRGVIFHNDHSAAAKKRAKSGRKR